MLDLKQSVNVLLQTEYKHLKPAQDGLLVSVGFLACAFLIQQCNYLLNFHSTLYLWRN